MMLLVLLLFSMMPPDTLHLASLHEAALEQDPRTRQLALEADVAAYNLENLNRRYRPRLVVQGQATYQSDVTSFPLQRPDVSVPTFSKDQYRLALDVDQLLYDGGQTARARALERARRDRSQASVRAERYRIKEQVNAAFFAVLLLDAQAEQLRVLETDLDARRSMLQARVRQGAALPGDVAALDAELIEVAQQQADVRTNRQTALARLAELTGRTVPEEAVLAPPEGVPVSAEGDGLRARPEYAVFDQTRRQLAQQADLAGVQLRPQVSAFAQAGYGRPGLDRFSDDFESFWQTGVRLRWTLWDWGASRREREAYAAQQRIVDTQEEAFGRDLRLAQAGYRNEEQRLEEMLRLDEQLIRHRQQIEAEAASRLENGVLTAADYLEKRHDVFRARLQQRLHHLERLQVRVDYRTTIGAALEENE